MAECRSPGCHSVEHLASQGVGSGALSASSRLAKKALGVDAWLFPVTLVALFGLLAQACVPGLRSDFVCAPDVTVPYSESPASLMSSELQGMASFYASLSGEWSGELQCSPDFPMSGSVTISIKTDTTDQMKMIVGVDRGQVGMDCGHEGTVLAGGQIGLSGSSLGGLSGETAALDAKIGKSGAIIEFAFDPSFDPGLAFVDGQMTIASDLSVSGIIDFGQQPTKSSAGISEQIGANCPLVLLGRIM